MRRLTRSLIPLLLMLIAAPSVQPQEPERKAPTPPLDVGVEEQVRVQLVLLDVRVLDRQDRTVSGLGREDFALFVDGREVAIASVDADCPLGDADDPHGAHDLAPIQVDVVEIDPLRVVLVFDYFHMDSASTALDAAGTALDSRRLGGEQHMVVSLGQVVRVELPFTNDVDAVRRTLDRMREDAALYAGNRGRLTEHRFFARLELLFDLLERVPGRKAIVLFSGPFQPDGFYHDPAFRDLSALAATTRTAVYPVDTGGLRTPLDPAFTWLGGPAMLRRLANETGGRMTADTNDLTLAYARARRDLGCTYTLGFDDDRPRLDQHRRVRVHALRPGARVVGPSSYVLRSRKRKAEAQFETAAMAPDMFAAGALGLTASVTEPRGPSRWEALIMVEAPALSPDAAGRGETRRLEGFVRNRAGTTIHRFRRDVGPEGGSIREECALRPGDYTVSAVLSVPGSATPFAATFDLIVPAIGEAQAGS